MSEWLQTLPQGDRETLAKMADMAGVGLDALGVAIISGYLRLVRDAPGALPEKDPLAGLSLKAAGGGS